MATTAPVIAAGCALGHHFLIGRVRSIVTEMEIAAHSIVGIVFLQLADTLYSGRLEHRDCNAVPVKDDDGHDCFISYLSFAPLLPASGCLKN